MEKTPGQIAREREAIHEKIRFIAARKESELERLRQEHEGILLDSGMRRKDLELERLRREREAVAQEFTEKMNREMDRLRALQAECPHRNRDASGHCPDCGK